MRILLTAGRLLVAHWPALFALGFLGVAVRGAAFWGALEISEWSPFVSQVVLLAMPLGLLIPVIVMLRVCYPSLRSLSRPRQDGLQPDIFGAGSSWGTGTIPAVPYTPGGGPAPAYAEPVDDHRPRGRLSDVALAVLVPFLTVYIVQGTADADHARYQNDAAFDEMAGLDIFTGDFDFGDRLGLLTGWPLVGAVAAAFVVRWLFGVLDRKVHFVGFVVLGVAVEVFWTTQVAYDAESLTNGLTAAFADLALFDWGAGTYQAITDEGQGATLAEVGAGVVGALGATLDAVDEVIIAPLGWLAIGTVVLGRQLMAPPSTEHRWLDQMTMPDRLRNVLEWLTQAIRDRFSALYQGLRMIMRGGVGSMLVFCLAFLAVMRAPLGVAWVVRAITGPVENDLWLFVISPWEESLGLAISLTLSGALIAAAVDTMARRGLVEDADPEGELSDGEGAIPGVVTR